MLRIDSLGDAGDAPTPAGRDYELIFDTPVSAALSPDDIGLLATFDLVNYDDSDDPDARVTLKGVDIRRAPLSEQPAPTPLTSYSFDAGPGDWAFSNQVHHYSAPVAATPPGALSLTATTNDECFGFWGATATGLALGGGDLVRVAFSIHSDSADPARTPSVRLRVASGDYQATALKMVTSMASGYNAPPTAPGRDYSLYLRAPATSPPGVLTLGFDLVGFTPDDDPTGTLSLTGVTLEKVE